MGIKQLKKILKKYCKDGIKEINIKDLKNKTIAIDTSIYLYKYTYTNNIIEGFIRQINHLLKYNITPIYLLDGKPTEDKRDLINKRKKMYNNKKEIIQELSNNIKEIEEKIKKLKNNYDEEDEEKNEIIKDNLDKYFLEINLINETIKKKKKGHIKIDWNKIDLLKELFKECDIFYYQCNGETDIYVKEFFSNNLIDYVITEDLDFLTHNCPNVLYNYNFLNINILHYNYEIILKELGMSKETFIDFCILCGCDYSPTVKGIGSIIAFKLIKKHKTIEEIIKNNEKFDFNNFNYKGSRKMFNLHPEINVLNKEVKIIKKDNYNNLFELLKNEKIQINYIIELINNLKSLKYIKKINSILDYI